MYFNNKLKEHIFIVLQTPLTIRKKISLNMLIPFGVLVIIIFLRFTIFIIFKVGILEIN